MSDQTTGTAPLLRLRDVTRTFGDGTIALDGVSVDVRAGEVVAIVGPSGSGKSTLLNILGLLDTPTEGTVILADTDVGALGDGARSDLRSRDLAFVFQRAHLLSSLSVEENVRLGIEYSPDHGDAHARAIDALRRCGLDDKAAAQARTLSGGEMQRVAIARALVRRARLWLADEPTGNLDTVQSVAIIDELRNHARQAGAALIVVTHEPEIAARLDRTITLRDGRIVCDTGTCLAPVVAASPTRRPRGHGGLARAIRTSTTMLRARTPGSRAGVVATALAVALAVTALGLSQSASAQVTSMFDAQRVAQVTASLSRNADPIDATQIRLDEVRGFPGVTGAELWLQHQQVPLNVGNLAATTADVVETTKTPDKTTGSTIVWAAGAGPELGPGDAILGTGLARRIGLGPIDAGAEVTVAGQRLRVVGLMESTRSGTAAGNAFVAAGSVAALPGSRNATLYVTTAPGAARQVAERLAPLADPFRQTVMEIDPVLGAEAFAGALTESVGASLQVLAVVAAFAGLGTVVFVNLLGITSRTAELGVRRAFGAKRLETAAMVASECAARSFTGAIIGLVVGLTAILAVTITARWEPVLDLRLLAVPLLGALVFGLVGAIAPAIHAARVEPADAVRS
ncbi:ABC transporter related protein [Xylanimonas cellulosilytica DSM 15894]|uniref:ABC transporter related protein n=1 Tax=Xylanimonas cellulosilytica (strain DSM 15894 / JCM 12276 / CECT 5975 / KCTC 9989 / LMG 20990 / NBRC 107835 / XIL07) TaxID=446471 RepID=D1BTC7_XYLCX|nr:ABC transporter ATP-binding protein/permease [Xylanimonas cellulosilytica]ACZ29069.1 ABC transporter related protein [Xylanimonas cellulosilytica DSM 15894]